MPAVAAVAATAAGHSTVRLVAEHCQCTELAAPTQMSRQAAAPAFAASVVVDASLQLHHWVFDVQTIRRIDPRAPLPRSSTGTLRRKQTPFARTTWQLIYREL